MSILCNSIYSFTDDDYSQPADRNYELDRNQLTLRETIGVGQFGDVYIGFFHLDHVFDQTNASCLSQSKENSFSNGNDSDKNVIYVAVKTCKAEADLTTSEKFLEEACK